MCVLFSLALPSQSLLAADNNGGSIASDIILASAEVRNNPEKFINTTPEVLPDWNTSDEEGVFNEELPQIKQNSDDVVPEVPSDWAVVDPNARPHETERPIPNKPKNTGKTASSVVQIPNEVSKEWGEKAVAEPTELSESGPVEPVNPALKIANEVSKEWGMEVIGRTTSATTSAVALPVEKALNYVEVPPDWDRHSLGFEGGGVRRGVPEEVRDKPPDKVVESQQNTEPIVKTKPLVSQAGIWSVLPYDVILNGKTEGALHAYETPSGYLLLPFIEIAQLLGDDLRLDAERQRVLYQRSRDGARFELNTETGEVLANGQSAGFLAEVTLVDMELGIFPSNAIQVFSGLHINRDDTKRIVELNLDKRLQFITGFELYVNGELLPYVNPEPRSLGHVLLLPVRPIIEELGGELIVSADQTTLTVVRKQDNAEISLNMNTGLVFLDGKPIGTAPNMAYVDRAQLMLPREALASLTGTYVTLLPGSRRIDVDLDGDLASIVHPGDTIRGRAQADGAMIDSVETFIDTRQTANAEVIGHYKDYNMTFQYATPTTVGDDAFTPDWLNLNAQSVDGWSVSVGDQDTQKRELDGVSVSRLKGLYYSNTLRSGILVGTLGQAQSGVRVLDGGDSVPTFSGQAAGVRFADHSGDFEAGIAVRNNEENGYKAAVASTYKRHNNPDFVLGELYQRSELAVGLYENNDKTSPGGRLGWDARLEPNDKVSFSARTDYSSSAVLAGIVGDDDIIDQANFSDLLSYGVGATFRQNQSTSYSLNHNRTLNAVFENPVDGAETWTEGSTLGVSLLPFQTRFSPWTYLSWEQTSASDDESVRRLTGQAAWNFGRYSLLAKHVDQKAEESGKTWLSSLELSREPWQRYFAKSSSVSLSPRANAWKGDANIHGSLGALLSFTSGQLLGKRTTFGMSYGRNLGVTVMNDTDNTETSEDAVSIIDGSDYFSSTLNYRYNRLLKFNSSYYSDLDGNHDSYASISAYYEFNPPRRLKGTKDNAGLLMGQVFLDENFDGIRQENEQGVGNARVVIQGTPIGLNTDQNGRFTIQNLPVGIYRLRADTSRMPLGYQSLPDSTPAVQIGDAKITEIAVPLTKGSQLSGVIYIDKNGNGELDKADERLENIGLELDSGAETASTAFGQFTFDFLPTGQYTVKVQSDTLPDDVLVDEQQNLTIDVQASERNRVLVRLLDKTH